MVSISCTHVSYNRVSPAHKWVRIDKDRQILTAYEGGKLAFKNPVRMGTDGKRTPDGIYHVESKSLMRNPSLYHELPMPYSVQFGGGYFIRGDRSAPNDPMERGCIGLLLTGPNPAKIFFDWVDAGTPVEITGRWHE